MNLFCGPISLIQVLLFPLLGIGGLILEIGFRDDDKFIFELSINGNSCRLGQACIWRSVEAGTVSWPLGGEGGLDSKLSIDQSLDFLSNIYSDCFEKSRVTLQEFYEVLQAQSIEPSLKLKELDKDQKDYFYMALSILFSFDVYLVPKFRYLMSRKAMPLRTLLHRQLEGCSLISTGGNNRFRREFCNKGLVLDGFGEVIFQGDLEQAIALIDQKVADSGRVDSDDDQFDFGDSLKNSDQDEPNDVL